MPGFLRNVLGENEQQWEGLREVLPLLAKKKYYQDLPHPLCAGVGTSAVRDSAFANIEKFSTRSLSNKIRVRR